MADRTEAARMPTFAVSSAGLSPAEKRHGETDSPSIPTPRICRQPMPSKIAATRHCVASQENKTIPMGNGGTGCSRLLAVTTVWEMISHPHVPNPVGA